MNTKKVRVKSLKVDLSKVPFKDPSKVNDGTNGKILEQAMKKQGFPIDSKGTIDLPSIDVEIKTRSANTNSHHTIGTMTFDDIINTPWDETPFKQKLQKQYRVTIRENASASGKIVDLSHPEIQKHLEEAYEDCRYQLEKEYLLQGKIIKGQTISSGQYGVLEHKPGPNGTGKSYALRIPNSGMKKLLGTADMLATGLFEFH